MDREASGLTAAIVTAQVTARHTLGRMLRAAGCVSLVAVATATEASDSIGSHRPDVVFIDVDADATPSEAERALAVCERFRLPAVYVGQRVTTYHLHTLELDRALGYVPLSGDPEQAQLLLLVSLARLRAQQSSAADSALLRHLSARQVEVLATLARRLTVPATAEALRLSPHTVRNHLKAIHRKLGVHSRVELLRRFGR